MSLLIQRVRCPKNTYLIASMVDGIAPKVVFKGRTVQVTPWSYFWDEFVKLNWVLVVPDHCNFGKGPNYGLYNAPKYTAKFIVMHLFVFNFYK